MSDAQKQFWSGETGAKWVAEHASFDALMAPVLDGLLERAGITPGSHVLDVGCGTGQSTCRAAALTGPTGHVTGVDISAPMLAEAATRSGDLAHVRLIEADAATHPFAPAQFDRMISRFGVMFFDDTKAAFAHLRSALKPGASLHIATWGSIARNPWFLEPAQAAKSVLGAPPPVDPDAPGPFALRDGPKTCAMLTAAGFTDVAVDTRDLELTPLGRLEEVCAFAVSGGPPKRTMDHFNAGPEAGLRIADALAPVFAKHYSQGQLRIPAEINFFAAKAPH